LAHDIAENGVSEISFEKDGSKHTAEMRAAPFEWDNVPGDLASIRDTTEQKALAGPLLQAHKMEALGLLAGGVAHDFNNLLTVIVNCATFVAESLEPNDASQRDVKQILAASDRAEALVAQLLALSRRKPSQPRVVDLGEMIAEMEPLLRRTLPADIEMTTVAPAGLWPVLVDPGRFDQVLMNLAVNAKDAMPKGGRLTVNIANKTTDNARGLLPAGDYVSLTVADTGTGIPQDVIARIFDP